MTAAPNAGRAARLAVPSIHDDVLGKRQAPAPFNLRVADRLREAASLLARQDANRFRTAAFKGTADTLAALPEDLRTLLEAGGLAALQQLPGVGDYIAGAVAEMAHTGKWAYLDRLRGSADVSDVFTTVPGVGPILARRFHDILHVETLEQLEAALQDDLIRIAGLGQRRRAGLLAVLDRMLDLTRFRRMASGDEPSVALLLEIDRIYRSKAARGELRTIAPRRFNAKCKAWLPIMHAGRGDWQFTALYSNSARAHELGKVEDWVVIHFQAKDGSEGQRTVVTAAYGPIAGERVVRGREQECLPLLESPPRSASSRGKS